MKCYALGLLKGQPNNQSSDIEWWDCNTVSFGLFGVNVSDKIHACQKELTELCFALQSGECEFASGIGYYVAAIRHIDGCCLIACDQKLTKAQTYILSLHMLHSFLTLEQVAHKIEFYMNEISPDFSEEQIRHISFLRKTELLADELEKTTQTVTTAMNEIIERGEAIDVLVERSEKLTETSFKFRERSKEMNSCWPKSCNIF